MARKASSKASSASARPVCAAMSAPPKFPRVRGGLGVAIVSTSEGLLTDAQARKKNLGGELLCYIW